ncbi:MAG: hypothetical protein E3J71_07275 [Candidatus Stahlbacteria bacterium]|nr:MAG: hypothetical protein E3J71_07275 [Candidatus Stahlbacteria bacterium]
MKKALLAVLAIALIIGFAGCSIFQKGSPYYPLAEGNKWEYSGTSKTIMDYPEGMDDVEITVNTTVVSEVMALEETTGDEPIEVWKIKAILTVDVEGVDPTTSYSYVDADKDYIYFYKDLDATEEWYKIPSKPDKDDTWTVTIEEVIIDSIVDSDTFTTTITFKTDYTVVETGVEANDYTDCLKIEAKPEDYDDYDSYESFDYWAKDVGSVKTEFKWVMTRPYGEEDTFTMTIEGETKLDKFTEGE